MFDADRNLQLELKLKVVLSFLPLNVRHQKVNMAIKSISMQGCNTTKYGNNNASARHLYKFSGRNKQNCIILKQL